MSVRLREMKIAASRLPGGGLSSGQINEVLAKLDEEAESRQSVLQVGLKTEQ